jgi:putative ABC transport system permease protein
MLKNFLTIAVRNILKYKAYSAINFIGLTCGTTLALLIITYVRSEMNYDVFHQNINNLYRLRYTAPNGMELATTPPPIAPVMKDFFPEVAATARMYGRNISVMRPEEQNSFEESDIYFADSTIFNLFSFEFVRGTSRKALQEPYSVIINEEMATKYFGDKDPMGESLVFSGKHPFKIIGIVKNFPENSHIRFNMLAPYESMYLLENKEASNEMRQNLAINFIISHSFTYVLLKPGADPKNVDKNMDAFIKKYAQPQLQVGQVFELMPVRDIHLKSTLLGEPRTTNSMENIYIFIGIGFLTLLIASINYVNLSTAQSFSRIKEIGIRKILGSFKYQLIGQFLAESLLFCVVAVILSFVAFYLTLPLLNELTGKSLLFSELVDGTLLVASIILFLGITLLAGGYPSYFVTTFNSIHSLKGFGGSQFGGHWLRKVLVIFQLTIACVLFSGSLMIFEQLEYINSRPLGFQRDHIITIPLFSQNLNGIFGSADSLFRVRLQSYRNEIENQTGVKKTTLSSNAPGLGSIYRNVIPEGFTKEDNLFVADLSVDYDFLTSYGIELAAGRMLSKDYGTDKSKAFIVNETAVKEFKWESPEKAIGKKIIREGKEGLVVGVVKDFNFNSLLTPISALVMEINESQLNMLTVKFENSNVEQTISKLEISWKKMFPEKAFEFNFLDDQLTQQYANFQNFGMIIQSFTVIAVLISCLGVYGLVLFVVQRKVKEIGVRKVLGANVVGILRLIYTDFVWLIVIGFILGIPFSYYLINEWLENFTYRSEISVFTYLISFTVVLVIVSVTISYQAIKASLTNPVKSLRSE